MLIGGGGCQLSRIRLSLLFLLPVFPSPPLSASILSNLSLLESNLHLIVFISHSSTSPPVLARALIPSQQIMSVFSLLHFNAPSHPTGLD